MAEYIKCRNCESPDCKGCNIKNLETMLNNGKFDCLMNGNRCVNPSADVAPVRHARWKSYGKNLGECSECGEIVSVRSNYCQNCSERWIWNNSEKPSCSRNQKEKMKMSDFKSDFEVIRSLGEPALLEQLAEECSELAQAALKLARLERGENPTPKAKIDCEAALMEEIADVHLCLGVISSHFECQNKLDDIEISKRERWAQRILEARGETPKEKKTRQSEFLKIFPKAKMCDGVIFACPINLTDFVGCRHYSDCAECKKDFWLTKVK